LAHEWRKSLELNLRQRPGFALKGIGAGAKRRAIAPLVWSTDGANTPIPFRSKPYNRAPAGAAAQPFWRIFMAERAEASELSPATAPAANLGRSSGSIASNISTRAGFTSEPAGHRTSSDRRAMAIAGRHWNAGEITQDRAGR
jgi:hypothetical protein